MPEPENDADICLILEGTYPYVTGGVSSWTHRLITHLPEFRFHLFCLVADGSPKSWVYPKPQNVIGQTDLVLVGDESEEGLFQRKEGPSPDLFRNVEEFHHRLLTGDTSGFSALYRSFLEVPEKKRLFHGLMESHESWEILKTFYQTQFGEESFLDFFWMWRTTHAPLFRVLSSELPRASLYHAMSTGYAGMLGVMGYLSTGRPLLLTEHGIYTRERKIEIALSEWIGGRFQREGKVRPVDETIRGFWMRIFQKMGRIVYDNADLIITLFEGNRQIEIRDGADPDRIRIIPNGISVGDRAPRSLKTSGIPRVIALVGRVVPIKDVKTFLQAARIVLDSEPETLFWVLGPTDHDKDYFQECLELSRFLELGPSISFMGSVDLSSYYPRIDLLVLTSLSEAQPLVIMEAGAEGIPVVASRVGACEELLMGRTPADRSLGPSGILTGVGNPQETALAMLALVRDPERAFRFGMAGRRRMDLFYKEQDVFDAYRSLYRERIP